MQTFVRFRIKTENYKDIFKERRKKRNCQGGCHTNASREANQYKT